MNAGLFTFILSLLLLIGYGLFYALNIILPYTMSGTPYGFRDLALLILDLFYNEITIYFVLFIGGILALYSRATSSSLVVSFILTLLALATVVVVYPMFKTILPPGDTFIYPQGLLLLERVLVIYAIFILLIEAVSAGDIRNY